MARATVGITEPTPQPLFPTELVVAIVIIIIIISSTERGHSASHDGANINTPFLCLVLLRAKHLDALKGKRARGFPRVITDLPEADVQFKGIRAWVAQGEKHQIVFFEMESWAEVPEHSHDYPQWGIVVDGKMKLVIDGEARICKKGDEYVIPAQAKHYAEFLSKSRVIDFFSEKMRYRIKSVR